MAPLPDVFSPDGTWPPGVWQVCPPGRGEGVEQLFPLRHVNNTDAFFQNVCSMRQPETDFVVTNWAMFVGNRGVLCNICFLPLQMEFFGSLIQITS